MTYRSLTRSLIDPGSEAKGYTSNTCQSAKGHNEKRGNRMSFALENPAMWSFGATHIVAFRVPMIPMYLHET